MANSLDLWTIQETITDIRPALLIESGTNRGGSALFYAVLFDLMDHGEVLTLDIQKLHNLTHKRVQFLLGSSMDEAVVAQGRARAAATKGPIMVVLDSDHREPHVY